MPAAPPRSSNRKHAEANASLQLSLFGELQFACGRQGDALLRLSEKKTSRHAGGEELHSTECK